MEFTDGRGSFKEDDSGFGARFRDLTGTWRPEDEELARIRRENLDLRQEILEDLRTFRGLARKHL